MLDSTVSFDEKVYLRELAKTQLEYAKLPVMEERKRLWYLHNSLKGERPMVVMEEMSFLEEIISPLKCTGKLAQSIEKQLLHNILVHEKIGDDKVIPDYFTIPAKIDTKFLGIEINRYFAENSIGYHTDTVINDLQNDFGKLSSSTYNYDREYTESFKSRVEEIIGDILPVKVINADNWWAFGLTGKVVDLMGMENMFCAIIDEPELFHKLMRLIQDDRISFLRWQEDNGLIFLNNGNDYMGAGSYCFCNELPQEDFAGKVRSVDSWGHINSQESIGISPIMFKTFILPYYIEIAKQFGLVYYGCCEPVHEFWIDGLERVPNLRKISISAWCNEEFMSETLTKSKIIYSRKPSPNYIGVEKEFDQRTFSQHIKKTVQLTKDCKTEFIFRDIYKLNGNIEKVKQAVDIVRNLTTK